MTSEQQEKVIYKKILIVTSEFLETNGSNIEISENLKNRNIDISSSSVGRYLNDKRIIRFLGKDVYEEIQERLKINKQIALSNGGLISQEKNEFARDNNGQFSGIIRK